MTVNYTSLLKLGQPVTGTESGTWGDVVNQQITSPLDQSIAGTVSLTSMTNADYTLTNGNGNAANEARYMAILVPSSLTLTAARNIIVPTASKMYLVQNSTTGGFAVTVKTVSGSGISVANGTRALLYCDGTNVVDAFTQLGTLTATSLTTTSLTTSTLVSSSSNGGQLAGFRNRVINGAGLVQQRAAPTLTASAQYGKADRWMIYATGGTSVSGSASVASQAGFSQGTGFGAVSASWTTGQFAAQQRIEAVNTQDLNSKQITISCKVYQNTGGARNMAIQLVKANASDNFTTTTSIGTGTAVSVADSTVTTLTYTLTLGSTDASNGLAIVIFDNAANTVVSKNYLVGDVQLEIGSVATPFEQRPFGLELMLCQRYYQKSYDLATTPGTATAVGSQQQRAAASALLITDTRFKVFSRATSPTVTIYNTSTGASGSVRDSSGASNFTVSVVNSIGMAGFPSINLSTTPTATNVMEFHYTAESEL